MEFFLQIVLILACLFYGARKGGIALGLLGGIGIVVLVFAFKLPPGKPPVDVILTIVAVVAASATLRLPADSTCCSNSRKKSCGAIRNMFLSSRRSRPAR